MLLLCSICERVTSRPSHSNAAVVLSAVKVLMKLMELLPADGSFIESLQRKLAPPLGEYVPIWIVILIAHCSRHGCVGFDTGN